MEDGRNIQVSQVDLVKPVEITVRENTDKCKTSCALRTSYIFSHDDFVETFDIMKWDVNKDSLYSRYLELSSKYSCREALM